MNHDTKLSAVALDCRTKMRMQFSAVRAGVVHHLNQHMPGLQAPQQRHRRHVDPVGQRPKRDPADVRPEQRADCWRRLVGPNYGLWRAVA